MASFLMPAQFMKAQRKPLASTVTPMMVMLLVTATKSGELPKPSLSTSQAVCLADFVRQDGWSAVDVVGAKGESPLSPSFSDGKSLEGVFYA